MTWGSKGTKRGVAFLVAAGIVYEIIAACCSSPQTAEINAHSRAGTLMKWVHVGCGQAAVFVAIAAFLDDENRWAIVSGGALAGGIMYTSYWHARDCGLACDLPGTEDDTALAPGNRTGAALNPPSNPGPRQSPYASPAYTRFTRS